MHRVKFGVKQFWCSSWFRLIFFIRARRTFCRTVRDSSCQWNHWVYRAHCGIAETGLISVITFWDNSINLMDHCAQFSLVHWLHWYFRTVFDYWPLIANALNSKYSNQNTSTYHALQRPTESISQMTSFCSASLWKYFFIYGPKKGLCLLLPYRQQPDRNSVDGNTVHDAISNRFFSSYDTATFNRTWSVLLKKPGFTCGPFWMLCVK